MYSLETIFQELRIVLIIGNSLQFKEKHCKLPNESNSVITDEETDTKIGRRNITHP